MADDSERQGASFSFPVDELTIEYPPQPVVREPIRLRVYIGATLVKDIEILGEARIDALHCITEGPKNYCVGIHIEVPPAFMLENNPPGGPSFRALTDVFKTPEGGYK